MKAALMTAVSSLVCAAALSAQQKPAAGATVSGHVYCADTNTPARMATVTLQPANYLDALAPGKEKHVTADGEAVQTLLDGSFVLHNVAPGTYYVVASQQGYISPLAQLYVPQSDHSAPEGDATKKPRIAAPRITVQSNLPVAVNVTLQRGAAVSGTILYDDGSPASNIGLTVLVRHKDQWVSIPSSPIGNTSYRAGTDDLGNYRISGLPAGEYLFKGSLSLSQSTYRTDEHGGTSMSMHSVYSLDVYSGGKTRRKDATPFTVSPGEERRGEDLEIPLSKLHTVRGNLIAAHDGHVLNGGRVSLLYADDKSIAANAALSKDEDGFTFSFVPEGDYILHVDAASDNDYVEVPNRDGNWPPSTTTTRVLRSYGQTDQPIHVGGDVSGLTVSVPDPPPQRAQSAQ